MKRIRISSSIANFAEKLRKRYPDHEDFRWFSTSPTLFFGCYHFLDYLRILLHPGQKAIFWCGSDLLNLSPFKARLLKQFSILHYVENEVEWLLLNKYEIPALVLPMFFGKAEDFPVSYTQADKPHVWLCAHPGRVAEYGVLRAKRIASRVPRIIFHIYGVDGENTDNVIFHGYVPEEQFNEEIRNYQAGLRLNSIDGFGEVLAKSILMGQYPISTIPYHGIDAAFSDDELVQLLKTLKGKNEPNSHRKFWFNLLNKRAEV